MRPERRPVTPEAEGSSPFRSARIVLPWGERYNHPEIRIFQGGFFDLSDLVYVDPFVVETSTRQKRCCPRGAEKTQIPFPQQVFPLFRPFF